MSEDEADALELAEAEALAEALEGRGGREALPEDAAEAAALLRYGGDDGVLDPDRAQAIYAELVGQGMPARPAPRRARLVTWLAGMAGALAAGLLLLLLRGPAAEVAAPAASDAPAAQTIEAEDASSLPAVPASLLSAQADAARADGRREALDAEMSRYREALLRELRSRYPTPIGMLGQRRDGRVR